MPNYPAFEGWDTPYFTPIPDQLFDEWLPHLSEAELKVLLYIMRRTFGFKKNSDAISLRQMAEGIVTHDGRRLDYGAGVALRSIQRAIPALLEKGLIEADKQITTAGDSATTVYRLRLRERSQNDHTPGQSARTPTDNLTPGVRTESLQQDTVQETENKRQDSNPPTPPKKERRSRPTASNAPTGPARDHPQPNPQPPPAPSAEPRSRPPVHEEPVVQGTTNPHREKLPPRQNSTAPAPTASLYIASVLEDFSRELGDAAHVPANVTQALRLWQQSRLGEQAFVQALYEAKKTLRQAQAHGVANKVAYFFVVLRDQLGLAGAGANRAPPQNGV